MTLPAMILGHASASNDSARNVHWAAVCALGCCVCMCARHARVPGCLKWPHAAIWLHLFCTAAHVCVWWHV